MWKRARSKSYIHYLRHIQVTSNAMAAMNLSTQISDQTLLELVLATFGRQAVLFADPVELLSYCFLLSFSFNQLAQLRDSHMVLPKRCALPLAFALPELLSRKHFNVSTVT